MDRGATPKDYIGYQSLIEDARDAAARGVMRAALRKVSGLGALPGEHHFYITFRTRTPGVQMADHLKDRFPDEMTVVIQHQYWDFEVHEDRFEIILKFGGVPQHLRVPFAAVTRFFDPSTTFSLEFRPPDGVGPVGETLTIEPRKPEPGAGPLARPDVPADGSADAEAQEGNTVVSLDAFRRK